MLLDPPVGTRIRAARMTVCPATRLSGSGASMNAVEPPDCFFDSQGVRAGLVVGRVLRQHTVRRDPIGRSCRVVEEQRVRCQVLPCYREQGALRGDRLDPGGVDCEVSHDLVQPHLEPGRRGVHLVGANQIGQRTPVGNAAFTSMNP